MIQKSIDGVEWTQDQIDAYDRARLPKAYSSTVHHANALLREALQRLERGRPGDRFAAAKLRWYERNNRRSARRLQARGRELGITLGAPVMQADLFGVEETTWN